MKQGWEIKKLGEVCDFQGGSQPPKSQFIYEPKKGYVRFLQIRDFASDKNITYIPESKKNRYCNEEDILLGRYGASVGKVLVNKAGAYNVAVMKTIPNETILYKRYLYYYLNTEDFQIRLLNTASRSAQDGFSKDDIFDFPILIPPLPEQQRIFSILNEAFAAIAKAKANAEQNLKNAKELFESYLQGVFENGNWEEQELGDLCMLITKGSSPKWQGIKYVDEPGILFVTSENVGEGKMLLNERKYVEEKFNLKDKKSILKKGDVLTNIVGASIGRTAIYDIDDFANINQAVCILRCNPKYILNNYLMNLLNSPFLKKILHDNEVNTARANLSLGFFNKLSIPCPTMAEQQAIVRQLDALRAETQKLEAVYQKKMDDLEELKKSILQKAFAGELGDGEPAEPKTEKSRRDDKIIENKINHPRTNPEGVL